MSGRCPDCGGSQWWKNAGSPRGPSAGHSYKCKCGHAFEKPERKE